MNVVVAGAGRMNQIDRSFATFDEYNPIFEVSHSVHSYNALLNAVRYSKNPEVISMMSILQKMEVSYTITHWWDIQLWHIYSQSNGILPDSESFSDLLEVIAESKDLEGNMHIK